MENYQGIFAGLLASPRRSFLPLSLLSSPLLQVERFQGYFSQ
jgi:hypothetical protein